MIEICPVRIAQRRQEDLSHAQQECWNRGGVLNPAEKLNQRMVCSILIQQTAREMKLEHPIPQGVSGFCVLPDKTSQTRFDFERCDCGDPGRLAHQQRTLAKEKTFEKLC